MKPFQRLLIVACLLFVSCSFPTLVLYDLWGLELGTFKDGLTSTYRSDVGDLVDAPRYVLSYKISGGYRTIEGHQTVRYTNNENDPLQEIIFHLYPNLLGGEMRVGTVAVDDVAILPAIEQYQSIMRLPLASPLSPGKSVIINIDFSVYVPPGGGSNYGILALEEGILSLAHAYPTLAVYDNNGWDTAIPSPQGDLLYADISFFQVTVDAPAELVIVASGMETSHGETGNRQQVTYAAGPVRDFYLVASPDFNRLSQTVGEVTVNSYGSLEYLAAAQAALEIGVMAIQDYSQRYSPYPYTEFDIVPISTSALGIEFPGMTGIRQSLYANTSNYYFELTIAHEVGHQWFYNLVGNHQQVEPWLDESLTQYLVLQYFTDTNPAKAQEFLAHLEDNLAWLGGQAIPIGQPVDAYSADTYISIIYNRGPLFVQALANEMGQQTFNTFLYDYIQAYSWENATTADFKTLAETECRCDLTPIFAEWVYP